MKKLFAIIAILGSISLSSFAQSHSDRITFGVGLLYERGLDATLAWEHETKYHNAWEYFVNGYLKWDECVGVAYKPCVWRGRNNHGNLRIGASAGSNTDKFLGGIHVGYEHNYALRNGWGLYWQAKCDLMLPDRKDLFRTGVTLGFKIPTR